MGIFGALEKRASIENPRTSLDRIFEIMEGNTVSSAGVKMDEGKAMALSAVWACVRTISDAVAMLSLILYERMERGRRRAEDHHLYPILHDQPNPHMTAFTQREVQQGHLLLWGNAYAEIERNNAGRTIALWPLLPDRTRPIRKSGKKWIVTRVDGRDVAIPSDRVLHIPGFGFDGLVGYSPVAIARNSFGLTAATEEFGSKFFANGTRLSGVLEHPGKLSDPARVNLAGSFREQHSGLSNAQRMAVLEEGMKWTQISVPPEDAQFLETRKFQTAEVARWFRVPPHMIGDVDRSTSWGTGIEQQGIGFVQYTLLPWFTRWEQAIGISLLTPEERRRFYAEFLVDNLLRGDSTARGAFYNSIFNVGGITPNEIAERENLPISPHPNADKRFIPLNLVPLDMADQMPESTDTVDEGGMDDEEMDEEMERSVESRAERDQRSVVLRQRIRSSQEPLFRDVASRIVTREVGAMRKALGVAFGPNGNMSDFDTWMRTFYAAHGELVAQRFLGALLTYSVPLRQAVAKELGMEDGPDVDAFARAYALGIGVRWTNTSRNRLEKLIGETPANEIEGKLVAQADEWEAHRAERFASREAVRAGEAMVLALYAGSGTVQRLRWLTIGETCPICQRMDGRTVGVNRPFLNKGDKVAGDGKTQGDLKTWKTIKHPPLHGGCDCMIVSA